MTQFIMTDETDLAAEQIELAVLQGRNQARIDAALEKDMLVVVDHAFEHGGTFLRYHSCHTTRAEAMNALVALAARDNTLILDVLPQ